MAPSPESYNGTAYRKQAVDCKGNDPSTCRDETAAERSIRQRFQQEGLTSSCSAAFRRLIYRHYQDNRRNLPWREQTAPWQVLVSEVMLQQTQVDRVVPKYLAFVQRFPDPRALYEAPLPELLAAWQGLGYNRRALNLQRAARMIVKQWNGTIPDDPRLLQQLPGIGPYTAGAICAFAFNQPQIFLETNIRAVLLHFFFGDQGGVTDKQLLPVAEAILDHANPRDWYNALMDYGSALKRRFPNPSRRSRHHSVQSRFEGSDRQLRGAVLRSLLSATPCRCSTLAQQLGVPPERLQPILTDLTREGFLHKNGSRYQIPRTTLHEQPPL